MTFISEEDCGAHWQKFVNDFELRVIAQMAPIKVINDPDCIEYVLISVDIILGEYYDHGCPRSFLDDCRNRIYNRAIEVLIKYGKMGVISKAISESAEYNWQKGPILGYVYAIENNNGAVKIGRSVNPQKRTDSIRTQSNGDVKRVFISTPMANYASVERRLHRHFSACRAVGEWFNISFDDAKERIEMFAELRGKTVVPGWQISTNKQDKQIPKATV